MYSTRYSNRSKSARINIYHDGLVVITLPKNLLNISVQDLISQKSSWIFRKLDFLLSLQVNPDISVDSVEHFSSKKLEAKDVISKRVDELASMYGFEFEKIRIKKLKTRWGSCSSKKNLNFNYKILFLPEDIRDYIIVHELCHLRQMNHSKKFWQEVENIIPDYKIKIETLKKYRMR